MKKVIPVLLAAALLLSGCSLTEQALKVKETYIDPAIEEAQTGAPSGTEGFAVGPNVTLDRTALTEFEPAGRVCSRLSENWIASLAASDSYGRLLPFVGAYVYGGDGERYETYGLVTEGGVIVLDAVLNYLRPASSVDAYGSLNYQNIYIMGMSVADDAAPSGVSEKYALCGADGSWVTDFEYTGVIPMELGVLCIVDENANAAVCYDETGTLVFDTRNFSTLSRLGAGTVSNLANCGSGLMQVLYSNGQKGFMDKTGSILNRYTAYPSYLDDALGFSEGLAAVSSGGAWGYMKTDGSFAIDRQYESATSFLNGVAVVKKDGAYQVINTSGDTVKELPDAKNVTLTAACLEVEAADGTITYYSVPSLTAMTVYDKPAQPFAYGYWVGGESGVRAMTSSGEELYFSGGKALRDATKDGLYLVELADGSCAVMDAWSRVVAAGKNLSFVKDTAAGTTYICDDGEAGDAKLYDASGALVADHVRLQNVDAAGAASGLYVGPTDGYVMCADDCTVGWKTTGDVWIFRYMLDIGD